MFKTELLGFFLMHYPLNPTMLDIRLLVMLNEKVTGGVFCSLQIAECAGNAINL